MSHPTLPKLIGADSELGNFILGNEERFITSSKWWSSGSSEAASSALLSHVEGGVRAHPNDFDSSYYSHSRRKSKSKFPSGGAIDSGWGRKFLTQNGGCIYIDLNHLELCTPEVLSAWDYVAAWHAMLRIARVALDSANTRIAPDRRIKVMVNNSDGHGNSYGSHLNFMVTRRTWDNIMFLKPYYLQWLASFQASAIICTGQGKVGSENNAPWVPFQISQRSDYFETLLGAQTTFHRPVVNSRDETLAGFSKSEDSPARLHCIFFDNTLCHVSSLLKVGIMQLILAMMEFGRVNPVLMLEEPFWAVGRFSRDPDLTRRMELAGGGIEVTAVELQMQFLREAKKFAKEGGFEGVVPRADEILELWEDVLQKLSVRDWEGLAPKLDWVLKRTILQSVIERDQLDWTSPEILYLDQIYSSLDLEEGLYWAYERSGFSDRVVEEKEIVHFQNEPPSNTRAWTRAMLLRAARPYVTSCDWTSISFRMLKGNRNIHYDVQLENPCGMTAEQTEAIFHTTTDIPELLDAINKVTPATPIAPTEQHTTTTYAGAFDNTGSSPRRVDSFEELLPLRLFDEEDETT